MDVRGGQSDGFTTVCAEEAVSEEESGGEANAGWMLSRCCWRYTLSHRSSSHPGRTKEQHHIRLNTSGKTSQQYFCLFGF